MLKKPKIIAAICLLAQSFTSFVLSFVYANRKKELSKAFLGLGLLGGLGGAYLLYSEYQDEQNDKLSIDTDDWESDDSDSDLDFFDKGDADDINFTIADENEKEDAEPSENASEEKAEESKE